jgi:hypothetical protein
MWWRYLITFVAGAWFMFLMIGIFMGGKGGN